ncbi:MAG: hypothetical protein U9Q80_03135 [Bacillota bacterium]|nr:hypothetical protein [Bacillota bacterium]
MKEILLLIFLSGLLSNPAYIYYEKGYSRNVEKYVIVNDENITIELKKESRKPDLSYMLSDAFPNSCNYLLNLIDRELNNTQTVGKDIRVIEMTLDDRWVILEADKDMLRIIYEKANMKDDCS